MREELSFVSGHVHRDRAIALAAFAREAKIQRLLHVLVAPPVGDYVAAHHFEKQMGAAPRRVHFFARRFEARAHRFAFETATLADAETTLRGESKTALVFGKLEVGVNASRLMIRPDTQIGVQWIRIDHLARIHFPLRVPDGFEFSKGLHKFRAVHFGQNLRARLAVTVFAGQRTRHSARRDLRPLP
jgi:hypothetical protein